MRSGKIGMFCLVVMLLAGLAAPSRAGGEMPPAEAAALWNYITKVSSYKGWGQWPDYRGSHTSRSPHGKTNQVWVNQAALGAAGPPLPPGAIEVKEAYDGAGRLVTVAVMYKVKGYNPAVGDWFWVLYAPDGTPKRAGKPKGCIGCHGAAAGNDYVAVHHFR